MIEKSLKILVQVFCFGVLGGVLGDALWRSVSFSAFARWRRISSPVVGFTSGLSASSPVRLEPFAGLRASFVGAGNLGHFLLRHRREAADARSRFQMHHGRARDADFCGTSKAWRFLTGWGEELLPVATACITGAGGSGWKTTMGCLMGFLVIFLFSEDPSVIGVCTVR